MLKFWWIDNTNQKMLDTSPKKRMLEVSILISRLEIYIYLTQLRVEKSIMKCLGISFFIGFWKKNVKRTKFEVNFLFSDPHHLEFRQCGNVLTNDSNHLFTKLTVYWKHIWCRILLHTHMVICITQLYKSLGLKISLNRLVVVFCCRLRVFIFYSVIIRPPEIEICYVH